MGPTIIARNYAETLLVLARNDGGDQAIDAYEAALDQVGSLLRAEPRVRHFLETPRVTSEDRKRVIRATFEGKVPRKFLTFLFVVVEKRRQGLLPQISDEYRTLVDELRGRVRAHITLARDEDATVRQEVVRTLEARLGKTVTPIFSTDPALVGGLVIRIGDQLYDGSLRRRIVGLKRRMLAAG